MEGSLWLRPHMDGSRNSMRGWCRGGAMDGIVAQGVSDGKGWTTVEGMWNPTLHVDYKALTR